MSYSYEEAAELIMEAGMELVKKGLISRTWGNISARLSDTEFLITPSGQAYDSLTPEKLVVVKIKDCSYQGQIRPSSEKGVHAEAYRYRPDVKFVVHTHQTYATALSVLGEDVTDFDEMYRDVLGDKIVCGQYAISSTKRLMKKMGKAIQNNLTSNGFLMRYHGVLCLGRDDRHAFAISEAMEEISRSIIGKTTGEQQASPEGLCAAYERRHGVDSTENRSTEAMRKRLEEMIPSTQWSCGFLSEHPMLCTYSKMGRKLRPMIDDMAQIVGTEIFTVTSDASVEKLSHALGEQNAFFIQGMGAFCAASSEDDARAVEQVLEKDLVCEMYATLMGRRHPLGRMDAYFQRNVYLKKYSKQMSR
ncbi:MAG: class II aldolase/adducin family protein [Lachnospiraceae bacterium]|nr:class II aldolase/adducin family protein [Lachnospiraceae bacterium]